MRFEGDVVIVEPRDEQGVLRNRFPVDAIPQAIAELAAQLEVESMVTAAESMFTYGSPVLPEGCTGAITARRMRLGKMSRFLTGNAQSVYVQGVYEPQLLEQKAAGF